MVDLREALHSFFMFFTVKLHQVIHLSLQSRRGNWFASVIEPVLEERDKFSLARVLDDVHGSRGISAAGVRMFVAWRIPRRMICPISSPRQIAERRGVARFQVRQKFAGGSDGRRARLAV